MMPAMNRSAAQWWICRISRPPRTSKLMCRVDAYASLIRTPSQRHVRPVVDDVGHAGLEPQREERTGQQQDDERVEDDLAEQERPVVREDLAEQDADAARRRASRSSSQVPVPSSARSTLMTAPRSSGRPVREVACGDEETLLVHADRQLRQRSGGRAEDDLRALRRVEGRLVARAQDVVRRLLVQGGRAADVGADLGVGDDVVDRPVRDDLVRYRGAPAGSRDRTLSPAGT